MSSSQSNRKFYVVRVKAGMQVIALSASHGFHNALRKYEQQYGEGKFGAANDEQMAAIHEHGLRVNSPQAFVIYRRADARRLLAAFKQANPEWARAYEVSLYEIGEFARHRDPRPIISWRVQVSEVPDGSTVKVGTVMQNGFITREAARNYIKKSKASDKILTPGYDYEALPNYGNV